MARPKHLKPSRNFPRLTKKSNDVTSDKDVMYNCIAYAYGAMNRKYWPGFDPDYFWPDGIPNTAEMGSFIKLFESIGYAVVADETKAKYVEGVEKVAIYADSKGVPTHAAKQVAAGKWASKLGDEEDIEHTVGAVSGGLYGEMAVFMQRKKAP